MPIIMSIAKDLVYFIWEVLMPIEVIVGTCFTIYMGIALPFILSLVLAVALGVLSVFVLVLGSMCGEIYTNTGQEC